MITPVHIIDMVTINPLFTSNVNGQVRKIIQNDEPNPIKTSNSIAKSETDASTRRISITNRQTIHKLSVITTLNQAQFKNLDANQKNNQLNERLNDNVVRFDNRSIASLTNLASSSSKIQINFYLKFFLYLYSINLTLICYLFSNNLFLIDL